MNNYWSKMGARRLSRRSALAAAGSAGVGTILTLACGGDSRSGKGASELLSEASDTSNRAVPGGVLPEAYNTDMLGWDAHVNISGGTGPHLKRVYSYLTRFGLGPVGQKPPDDRSVLGDAAEGWEFSPDRRQITFRLRANHKFDPRPPTSGRAMTVADVKWSFDRVAAVLPSRGELVSSLGGGPVESVAATDDRTIVMKLAYPYLGLPWMLSWHTFFLIMPVEAEDRFNAKSETRGSGPFVLERAEPSIGWQFRKNPDWYVKGRPLLDAISVRIIPESSVALTQFESGNLWAGYDIDQEHILRVKRDHPEMVLLQDPPSGLRASGLIIPSARADSPLKDVRLRRAASMLIDRDLWLETFGNAVEFRNSGLPFETSWSSHIQPQASSWVDPKGDGLGEGAKYFKYDPAEARKLVSAAGHQKVRVPLAHHNRGDHKDVEVIANMMQEGGIFEIPIVILDYNTEYRDYQRAKGLVFDGFFRDSLGSYNVDATWMSNFSPEGSRAISPQPIPKITDAILRSRSETDATRQEEQFKQIQRDLALEMPAIPFPGYTTTYSLRWPWLKNHSVFGYEGPSEHLSSARADTEYWFDSSLKA